MNKIFEPELGQMFFGQSWQELECPEFVVSLLRVLGELLKQKKLVEYDPTSNNGAQYKNNVFEIQAYSWNEDEEQSYNFKWKDVEVSWYKYLGRSTTINKVIDIEHAIQMFCECVDSLKKKGL